MKKKPIVFATSAALVAVTLALLTSAKPDANQNGDKIAVVNFKACIESSKLGKEEQDRFNNLKKEMETQLAAKEKELNELAPKLTEEYMSTLNPEAENELKQKFKMLSQDLSAQQNHYYQLLNQANYQIMEKLNNSVTTASKKVAEEKGYKLVLNEEACFYYDPSQFDVSKDIVAAMDSTYEKDKEIESKKSKEADQKVK